MRGGGGFKTFRRTFLCLRVPNNSVGEHFCAVFQKISGSEKGYGCGGGYGGIKIFRRKFFCLREPANFVGENFCAAFEKHSGSEELHG